MERGGFGEILPEVMMLAPREILSLRVIFYKLYIIPKIECLQVENIKLDTYLREYEVYFWINASIVAFLSNHMSFGILMTSLQNLNSNLLQNVKKNQFILRLKFNYSSLLAIILSAIFLSCVLSLVIYANNVQPHASGEHGVEHFQKERRLAN